MTRKAINGRYLVHKWKSLICIAFLLLLCITGLPLKILWAVLDIIAIYVLGSGLYLWIKRRNVPFETWLAALQSERPEAVISDAVVLWFAGRPGQRNGTID